LCSIFTFIKEFTENLPSSIFDQEEVVHHYLEDSTFRKELSSPSLGHLVKLVIDILFNFSQQIAKVASITNADEMKSVYLPNSVCQLINEILANLLYSTEDIDCVQSILEIYSSLIKVFGEI